MVGVVTVLSTLRAVSVWAGLAVVVIGGSFPLAIGPTLVDPSPLRGYDVGRRGLRRFDSAGFTV